MPEVAGQGMITRGDVKGIRELRSGVQASVCLGSSSEHGYATITLTSKSPRVLEALRALKTVLAEEAFEHTRNVVEADAAWRTS